MTCSKDTFILLYGAWHSVFTLHKRAVQNIFSCVQRKKESHIFAGFVSKWWQNCGCVIPWTPPRCVIWSVPLSEKRRKAGDAHEGSTGSVSSEYSCRLGLLHVDRLAESRDSRRWPGNMRVSAAQSHDWQRCWFWSSIHLWKEKGRRDIYTRHKACLSGFFASRDKKANAFPGQKQELDIPFFFLQLRKQMERKENGMRQERGH